MYGVIRDVPSLVPKVNRLIDVWRSRKVIDDGIRDSLEASVNTALADARGHRDRRNVAKVETHFDEPDSVPEDAVSIQDESVSSDMGNEEEVKPEETEFDDTQNQMHIDTFLCESAELYHLKKDLDALRSNVVLSPAVHA